MLFPLQFYYSIRSNPSLRPLSLSIWCILQLPISVRKVVITQCQMWEVDPEQISSVHIPVLYTEHKSSIIYLPDFVSALSEAVKSPVYASILWMVARTCPEPRSLDESDTVRQDGFDKELAASQTIFSEHQLVSYSAFFRNQPGINDPGRWWVDETHRISRSFIDSVSHKVLYPHVNRKKNVSDETRKEYQQYRPNVDYVRSVDIEVLYHETGVRVGGNVEMRDAWKFNDLKPRMYYCNGGQQYWASTYMKVIAVKIMEAIPSTSVRLRTRPDAFLSSDTDTDYVTAWDFTSFTTTLSELKHFLWYVARLLERESVTVTLFDFYHGYHDILLHELIDEYNQVANMNAPFEIHRMVGRFVSENSISLYQANSGMLGVAGNIGFSTALHGLIVCRECGVKRCVCVGDDALGITSEDPNLHLTPALRAIGLIHPDKFGIIHPGQSEGSGPIRFLKRRFERISGSFQMNYLLNFPVSPYIDGEAGHRTKPVDFSYQARIYKFATSTMTLLWEIRDHPELTDIEMETTMTFLRTAYKALRLPVVGLLPGALFRPDPQNPDDVVELGFVIPAIRGLDPRRVDWLDFILENSPSLFFKCPVYMHRQDVTLLGKGEKVMLPENVYWSLMEDMGYVKTENIKEWKFIGHTDSKAALRRMVRREADSDLVLAQVVTCIKEIPSFFVPPSLKGDIALHMDLDDIF